jgi:hypothetical protein
MALQLGGCVGGLTTPTVKIIFVAKYAQGPRKWTDSLIRPKRRKMDARFVPEGKRPLGRPRRKREDGIRMDLRENGWGSVEWIQLAPDRDRWRAVVNTVMKLRVLAPRN